jgi:biopolymer transport protein ExbB
VLAQLDGFAHDLHAFLTTGVRLSAATPTPPVRLAAARG